MPHPFLSRPPARPSPVTTVLALLVYHPLQLDAIGLAPPVARLLPSLPRAPPSAPPSAPIHPPSLARLKHDAAECWRRRRPCTVVFLILRRRRLSVMG